MSAHLCYEVAAMSTTMIMEPDIQQKLAILGDEASDAAADHGSFSRLRNTIVEQSRRVPAADTGREAALFLLL
jgi:hypothetical protein